MSPETAPAQGNITTSASRLRMLHIAMIAGAVLLGLAAIYLAFLKPQKKTNANTAAAGGSGTTGDTSGSTASTGTVYTPSTQSYTDLVINEGNTTTDSTQNNTNTVTGNTGPVSITPGPIEIPPPPPAVSSPPPVVTPPPVSTTSAGTPPPAAPVTVPYVVKKGDTLSAIAARYHTSWQHIYNLNKTTIDTWASRHGNPIAGGPWNNIFINEPIQVPN